MIAEYEFELRAVCPIHAELIDVYSVRITSQSIVKVEDILAFVAKYERMQIFQETMTQEIAVGLGVRVRTVGMHAGVKVTCEAP